MEKPERADIGDVVKITASGQQYTSYTDFFEKFCPEFYYGYNKSKPCLKNGMLCTVVFYEYDHEPACSHDMYVVELETNPGVYYLVNEHAFEICETMKSPSIEIDEVMMSDLFEVISCR